MSNESIRAAFERMWQHTCSALSSQTRGFSYGVCETDANTTEKTVEIENFALENGAKILVYFLNPFESADRYYTLNVNDTGAKNIMWGDEFLHNQIGERGMESGIFDLIYLENYKGYGEAWVFVNAAHTYEADYAQSATIAQGGYYGKCTTAPEIPDKTVWIDNFELKDGVKVLVTFDKDNIAISPTLNVSNTGASHIGTYEDGILEDDLLEGTHEFIYHDDTDMWELLDAYSVPHAIKASSADSAMRAYCDSEGVQIEGGYMKAAQAVDQLNPGERYSVLLARHGSEDAPCVSREIEYDVSNNWLDITCRDAYRVEYATTATTATTVGTSTVGGATQPVYISDGTPTAVSKVAVAYGGTGATTAAGARTNLDVYSKSEINDKFGFAAHYCEVPFDDGVDEVTVDYSQLYNWLGQQRHPQVGDLVQDDDCDFFVVIAVNARDIELVRLTHTDELLTRINNLENNIGNSLITELKNPNGGPFGSIGEALDELQYLGAECAMYMAEVDVCTGDDKVLINWCSGCGDHAIVIANGSVHYTYKTDDGWELTEYVTRTDVYTKREVDAMVSSGGGSTGGLSIREIKFTDRPTAYEWLCNNFTKVMKSFVTASTFPAPICFENISATYGDAGVSSIVFTTPLFYPENGGDSMVIRSLYMKIEQDNVSISESPIGVQLNPSNNYVTFTELSHLPDEGWSQLSAELTIYYIG